MMAKYKGKVTNLLIINILLLIVFDIVVLTFSLILTKDYIINSQVYAINLSILLFFMMGYLSERFELESNKLLLKYYLISTFIISCDILISKFKGVDIITTESYLFAHTKNALGVFICFGIIVAAYKLGNEKKKFYQLCLVVYIRFQLLVLFLIQNRSGVAGLAITLGFFYIYRSKMKQKLVLLILILMSFLFYRYNYSFNAFVGWSLRLSSISNYGGDFTSGRLEMINEALYIIKNNLFAGIGNYYVDNLYLNLLAQFGIIASSFIFGIIIILARQIFIYKNKNEALINSLILFSLTVSVFEGFSPFGPGTSYVLLWFLYGNYARKRS
jgi:hypothetical protein